MILNNRNELHQDDLEGKDEFIQLFKIYLDKSAGAARNLINSFPQTAATTFAFSSVVSFFYMIRSIRDRLADIQIIFGTGQV